MTCTGDAGTGCWRCWPLNSRRDPGGTHPCGGLFLWVTMPEGIDTDALLPTMAAHKAAYIPGRTFFADGNERRCLRLNYSNASEEDMTRGMTIMGQVFRDALAKG